MYAKVFQQIFESSLAEDYTTRHIFMDLLVLADRTGVVDMTPESIARRTKIPLKTVRAALAVLEGPDKRSRSTKNAGCRIVRLSAHRDWGWRIVNFIHYHRKMRDENARREANRLYQRRHRKRQREALAAVRAVSAVSAVSRLSDGSASVSRCQPVSATGVDGVATSPHGTKTCGDGLSAPVSTCQHPSAHTDRDVNRNKQKEEEEKAVVKQQQPRAARSVCFCEEAAAKALRAIQTSADLSSLTAGKGILFACGIQVPKARVLADTYALHRIKAVVIAAARKGPRKLGGWIIQALEENWTV